MTISCPSCVYALSIWLVVFCIGGCSKPRLNEFPSPSEEVLAPSHIARPIRLGVVPWDDEREFSHRTGADLALIPLVPYGLGWHQGGTNDSIPEAMLPAYGITFPTKDEEAFRLLLSWLEDSGDFESVVTVRDFKQGMEMNCDLVFESSLQEYREKYWVSFYGLSFLGLVPVLMGFPVSGVWGEIAMEYRFIEAHTSDVMLEGMIEERGTTKLTAATPVGYLYGANVTEQTRYDWEYDNMYPAMERVLVRLMDHARSGLPPAADPSWSAGLRREQFENRKEMLREAEEALDEAGRYDPTSQEVKELRERIMKIKQKMELP